MMAMQGEDYSTLESIRTTGGVRPDATWDANLAAARENAALARDLGLSLVSMHAGFVPERRADPERGKVIDRMKAIIDVFAEAGVRVAFETGQESEGGMARALLDLRRPGAGVNFDPANMILYGMGDPVEAFDLLHEWVRQIHVKDATPSPTPGTWGTEVPVGQGAVDWDPLFRVAEKRNVDVDLVIERESGSARIEDVKQAHALIRRHLADPS
jgi:sugar phosphate isomerase/epimerase